MTPEQETIIIKTADVISYNLKVLSLHAGNHRYTLISLSTDITNTANERYLRLYHYDPFNQCQILHLPQQIKFALRAAQKHDLHECDNAEDCPKTVPSDADITREDATIRIEHLCDQYNKLVDRQKLEGTQESAIEIMRLRERIKALKEVHQ